MINKLRKKFIITAMLSVFALLLVILSVINFVNFSIVSDEADKVLDRIIAGGGAFAQSMPTPGVEQGWREGNRPPIGPNSPELAATTRYFTVTFDQNGAATMVDMRMSAVDQAEAVAWAQTLSDGKGGWTRTYYRYRVWTDDMGTHVTVIDQNRELSPSYRVLIASAVGVGLGLVVTLLALVGISKAAVAPIEQSDRRQKRFIRDAAFEIKNPITIIDANRHILETRDGQSEETKAIDKEVKRLTRLVQGLDSLLLLEDVDDKQNFKAFDLSALTQELCGAYAKSFADSGKELKTHIGEHLEYFGDAMQIGELLDIALENALTYGKTHAMLDLAREGERLVLTIANDADLEEDGPLDSVFERFYRSEEVQRSGVVGTGIRLSVAKEIVDKHGGRIKAESKDGHFVLKVEL